MSLKKIASVEDRFTVRVAKFLSELLRLEETYKVAMGPDIETGGEDLRFSISCGNFGDRECPDKRVYTLKHRRYGSISVVLSTENRL